MSFNRSIFIFRRDLRLEDNTGLNAALKLSKEVIPIFILDPRQLEPHAYRSVPGMQFLFESLRELDREFRALGTKLHLVWGAAETILDTLLVESKAEAVFLNRDYTPFSTKRDEAIYAACKDRGVVFSTHHDALLHEPKASLKPDGSPYTVFTPFFKKNSKEPPPKPISLVSKNFTSTSFSASKDLDIFASLLPNPSTTLFRNGGRKEALSILTTSFKSLTNYNDTRDIPSRQGTSGLSPHHKFGTVSIREVYWSAKETFSPENRFITELYWRDFMTCVGYFFPYVFGNAFQKKFENLEWNDDEELFQRWCVGETGFPIVDAGMRELNETGYMHNRVRMIVASFLTKDLHIDWRKGERYFATKLLDFDPAVNNGSWQWAASTGCDAQPYFRIFNPWLQQLRFDPDALYIKRWIPELTHLPPQTIHSLEKNFQVIKGYAPPVVNHVIEKAITEKRYTECAKGIPSHA